MQDELFTCEIAIASEQLALDHRDPSDCFIAAKAQVRGAILGAAVDRLIDCAAIGHGEPIAVAPYGLSSAD